MYRKVQERRQQEEVMAAGVENLVSCPFCCFMIIMPDPENKVLECLNPECLKESCRCVFTGGGGGGGCVCLEGVFLSH